MALRWRRAPRASIATLLVLGSGACATQEEQLQSRDAHADTVVESAMDSQAIDAPDARSDSGVSIDAPIGPDPDRPDVPSSMPDRCAAREECNDRDDTCDGVVDEGCPRGVSVSMPPRFGPLSRGAASGNRAQGIAGRDEVLVGFYGRKGGVIDNLGALVAPLSIVADTTRTPFTYAVRTGAINELPAHGGSGGSGFREACPVDSILTTLRVVHRNGCTSPGICYEVVGDLIGQCSRVAITLEGTSWAVSFVPVSELRVMGSDAERTSFVAPPGPYGGLWMSTGAFVDQLSVGQVDVGLLRR
ncbi:MAG: hypothetical protein JNK05_15140 [Myxococcales bacterium]|nr:hypothetical protein [Myxococcales bacterium]